MIGMGDVVAVIESCATFVLLSSFIDMGDVVAVTDSFVASMLAESLVPLLYCLEIRHMGLCYSK